MLLWDCLVILRELSVHSFELWIENNVKDFFFTGTACLARGMSGYVDSLFSGAIGHYLNSTMHMKYEYLSHYPDFFSFALMIIFTGKL